MLASDLVIQWNDATIDAIRSDAGSANPGDGSRVFALVQTAVYDAVNAITKQYTSFALTTEAPSWASKEAAVATAARDVLAGLYPQQVAKFNSLLTQHLAAIPDGPAETAGITIGHDAAATILSLRSNDGSKGGSDYVFTNLPGHWQVAPLHPNQSAWGPNWGEVSPLAMRYAADFDVPPPPALNNQEYADAYNEVKSLGALNSTTRTAEQTEIGLFWAYDRAVMGPPTVLFNQAVQTIAEAKGNSLEDNARLFAMVNIAMADAGVATWKAKFDYDFWRPITAIREGDTDGNPLTVADPNWVPLGAPGADPNSTADDFTPPFPAYTSGHAAFGAATFRTLANFYGSDNFNYSLTSEELPGVVRNYSSFSQAALENGRSRIYLGVHWEFDNTLGVDLGNRIADYLAESMFIERDGGVLVQVQRVDGGYHAHKLDAGTPIDIMASGNQIKIVNFHTREVLYQEPMNEVAAIRIDQRNEATDFTRLIVETGTVIPQSMVIEIVGDEDWFDGFGLTTGDGNDWIQVYGDQIQAVGTTPIIHLYGIGYLDIGTHGGNDSIGVYQEQHGRQIDIAAYEGNDHYELAGRNAKFYVSDTAGYDTLNFQFALAGFEFDMAANNGQQQTVGPNSVRLWGNIEKLIAGKWDDRIYGTDGIDHIDGGEGNDVIYGRNGNDFLVGGLGDDLIYGEGGHDNIYGGLGNDVLIGGYGNDYIYGGWGRDLLIGSQGADWLAGEWDDDLIVGGVTAHDAYELALWAIMAEWTSGRTRAQRQQNIEYGTGATRANGTYLLRKNVTLWDDSFVDDISKGLGDAWVFNYATDKVIE